MLVKIDDLIDTAWDLLNIINASVFVIRASMLENVRLLIDMEVTFL